MSAPTDFEIIPATVDHLSEIQSIAFNTWPSTFDQILTKEQIDYMLGGMYSLETLESLMRRNGHQYSLAKMNTKYLGFCSFEHNIDTSKKTKIHRIYLLPETQGKGIGKRLMMHVVDQARKKGDLAVYLNVNKYNTKAISFYRHFGMEIVSEEIIDIGSGFVMDDYVMEVPI